MNIVFAVSDSYCDKLCVVITSVLENNKNQTIFFYILSSDFSQSSRSKINNLCAIYENAKAIFISPDDSSLVDLNLNIEEPKPEENSSSSEIDLNLDSDSDGLDPEDYS